MAIMVPRHIERHPTYDRFEEEVSRSPYARLLDGQENHEEVYQGSSTYMMQQVGGLRFCNMRQLSRRVKIMLDWGVHGRRMKLMGLDDSGQCPICMETD
jgi:hypothetical protein